MTARHNILRRSTVKMLTICGVTGIIYAAAAALAAYYARVRVGHVEAGLRTHDKWQPFPEEINRQVVGAVADLHFAPTGRARDSLFALRPIKSPPVKFILSDIVSHAERHQAFNE